jgi:hypothetical protein
MTTCRHEGASVEGESLIYGRWSHPPRVRPVGLRKTGKIRRNGWVEVDARLKVVPQRPTPPGGFDPGDRILCHTAAFECDSVIDRGQSSSPAHRGWTGILRGSAKATIVREMAQG